MRSDTDSSIERTSTSAANLIDRANKRARRSVQFAQAGDQENCGQPWRQKGYSQKLVGSREHWRAARAGWGDFERFNQAVMSPRLVQSLPK
jgi:hypothetical protein